MRVLMEQKILDGNHDIILMCMARFNKREEFYDHLVVAPDREDLVLLFRWTPKWKVTVHKLERITIE